MNILRLFFESLKGTCYQWRHAFYVIGVLWTFLAALALMLGPWWLFLPYIAIGAAHFCFYEKCCTWRAKP